MNIEELEFIRDLTDDLSSMSDNFGDVCCEIDSNKELNTITMLALWSIRQQIGLIENILNKFRLDINEKYHEEWVKKYPQMKKEGQEPLPKSNKN